ncbi:hypothetical protein PF005_g21327 [Phytophthora fragariae]|uniref:Uncharacterized protein n=1 Tax=Phytophthora fragariae TaxID=53985 RepID=A0A6A3WS83_9STRA|nr:hypothetical protein PF003_g23737 [Phytophthora fragariae]KAE9185253.1 hypothetical protein PF005_g21327 [Phytophthora fragariae]
MTAEGSPSAWINSANFTNSANPTTATAMKTAVGVACSTKFDEEASQDQGSDADERG